MKGFGLLPLAALLASSAIGVMARAEVATDGVASNGSVRDSDLFVSPSDAPAEVKSSSELSSGPDSRSPSELRARPAKTPSEMQSSAEALSPGERRAEAISPSDHPAAGALSPGETRLRSIHDPDLPVGGAAPVLRSGPAGHGSLRQPSYAQPFPVGGEPPRPSGGFADLGSLGRRASAGIEGPSSTWYARRALSKALYEGWRCESRKYVEHGGETLRLCGPTWVRRLSWAGGVGYVPIYPPEGIVLDDLPGESARVSSGGRSYHVVRAVFYERVVEGGREAYRVVRPPLGATVPELPRFALELDGGIAQFDDVFYRPTTGGYVLIAEP